MRHQPFSTKLKKVIRYPFNLEFINSQQKALKLLDTLLEVEPTQETKLLRQDIYQSWNLADITAVLAKHVNKVLWTNQINIQIFDLKTKWFLWRNILGSIDHLDNPQKSTSERKLNLLHEISSIFDLGK